MCCRRLLVIRVVDLLELSISFNGTLEVSGDSMMIRCYDGTIDVGYNSNNNKGTDGDEPGAIRVQGRRSLPLGRPALEHSGPDVPVQVVGGQLRHQADQEGHSLRFGVRAHCQLPSEVGQTRYRLNFFGQYIECDNLMLPVYCYIRDRQSFCHD